MAESRREIQARLLMELGRVVDVARRALADDSASEARLAVAQAQYAEEFDRWVRGEFVEFCRIQGNIVKHFHNRVLAPGNYITGLIMAGRKPERRPEFRGELEKTIERVMQALLAIPADDLDFAAPAKSAFATYKRLRALCATATRHVHLLDPYLSARAFLLYFDEVPQNVEIKAVTDTSVMNPRRDPQMLFRRDQILAASELFATERRDHYSLITTDLHARHIRVDDRIFQLDGPAARAGMDHDYFIIETDGNPALQRTLDDRIGSGVVWCGPGVARHRRWCRTCAAVSDVKPNGLCGTCNSAL